MTHLSRYRQFVGINQLFEVSPRDGTKHAARLIGIVNIQFRNKPPLLGALTTHLGRRRQAIRIDEILKGVSIDRTDDISRFIRIENIHPVRD